MSPDPAKRRSLPFLPSLKIGGARRIRRESRLRWLAKIETATVGVEASKEEARS
jgi:hypothetical protein